MTKREPTKTAVTRRWYDDACGTAHALELLGERWALLIVRELILGPRRFSELKASLPGISAQALSQRLEGFEAAGIAKRRLLPPPASVQVYELTEWGYEAEPILQATGRWAARSPAHDQTLPLSAVSMMVSLRTMIVPDKASGLELRVGFQFGRDAYSAHVSNSSFNVTPGDDGKADIRFECAPEIMASIIYGGVKISEAEAAGELIFTGDKGLAKKFLSLFELPPKADCEI